MSSHVLIVVSADQTHALDHLLEVAYVSSRDRQVYLWLRGLDLAWVNELLDPVVAEHGPNFSGVEFLRDADCGRVSAIAATADFCVVGSQTLPAWLNVRGIPVCSIAEGLALLEAEIMTPANLAS